MKGHKMPVPLWASILSAAEDWHVPPWVIEERCSAYWWTRYLEWAAIKGSVQAEEMRKMNRGK